MLDRADLTRRMLAAADGDRDAIEPLFRALWPTVVRYATRLVGDAALAEDCAQEALARLFGQVDRFDRDGDALTWALAHATWQCRTARRRRERRAEEIGGIDENADAVDGVALVEHRQLVRAAVDAVDALAPRDRDVIAAALADDAALRAELAPATFRKRLERALNRLRTMWRSRHGTL